MTDRHGGDADWTSALKEDDSWGDWGRAPAGDGGGLAPDALTPGRAVRLTEMMTPSNAGRTASRNSIVYLVTTQSHKLFIDVPKFAAIDELAAQAQLYADLYLNTYCLIPEQWLGLATRREHLSPELASYVGLRSKHDDSEPIPAELVHWERVLSACIQGSIKRIADTEVLLTVEGKDA